MSSDSRSQLLLASQAEGLPAWPVSPEKPLPWLRAGKGTGVQSTAAFRAGGWDSAQLSSRSPPASAHSALPFGLGESPVGSQDRDQILEQSLGLAMSWVLSGQPDGENQSRRAARRGGTQEHGPGRHAKGAQLEALAAGTVEEDRDQQEERQQQN